MGRLRRAAAGFNLSLSSSRGPGDDGSGWNPMSEEILRTLDFGRDVMETLGAVCSIRGDEYSGWVPRTHHQACGGQWRCMESDVRNHSTATIYAVDTD